MMQDLRGIAEQGRLVGRVSRLGGATQVVAELARLGAAIGVWLAVWVFAGTALATEVWETAPPIPPLPAGGVEGHTDHDGARIWYASFGSGPVVILLHGQLGSSDNFGNQVPALIAARRRVIVIDSRGQGRSTRDARPFTYELMESDVIAVMDDLQLARAAVVGWSDGGILGLIMAMRHPERVTRVFAYGANMDPGGLQPNVGELPILAQFIPMAAGAYARLSPTPNDFEALAGAMGQMTASQPNYTAADLARIRGPAIAIADGEHEELIRLDHTRYLARSIPGARLIIVPGVSHFGPIQDPAAFNRAMLEFLGSP